MASNPKAGRRGTAVFLVLSVEVRVAAPRARVWRSLARDLAKWWPRGFHSLPGTRRMVLEPRLGGRMYEDAGRGDGLLWYTVAGILAGRRLVLAGDISADFGGPARSLVTIDLEDDGEGTRVRLADSLCGRVDRANARAIRNGWEILLAQGLRPHAEAAAGRRRRAPR